MAPYQITISYDGTEFYGYQRQSGLRTVQGEIERALHSIGWSGKSILSSGRTDAGVHAEGQIAAFTFDWKHTEEDLQNALNQSLPDDVSIRKIVSVKDDFHPRYNAKFRIYRYQIYYARSRNPILERYSWRVWPEPDFELMNSAAKYVTGIHDFQSFGKPYSKNGRTERIIKSAEWEIGNSNLAYFKIKANSFLYHMVRRIVFVLISVGQLKVRSEEIKSCLEGIGNLPPGIAPAKGLFLEEIIY